MIFLNKRLIYSSRHKNSTIKIILMSHQGYNSANNSILVALFFYAGEAMFIIIELRNFSSHSSNWGNAKCPVLTMEIKPYL